MTSFGGAYGLELAGCSSGLQKTAQPLHSRGACYDTSLPLRTRVLLRLEYVYNLARNNVLDGEQLYYILCSLCNIPGVPA